jgi:hypothetical protein
MCFVQGQTLRKRISLHGPWLSQNRLQKILALVEVIEMPRDCTSLRNSMSGIAERSASEQLMYSASQVESAVSV